MRPLLALILAVGIIFGVQSFISASAGKVVERAKVVETQADGTYSIEVTLTFDAGPDAFALEADDAPSVLIEQRGKEILRRTESVEAGVAMVAEAPSIVVGRNEFYIASSPADNDATKVRIARIRVLRNGDEIAKHWIESEPGLAVEGTFAIDVAESDGHAH